jgi:hypothetical protein
MSSNLLHPTNFNASNHTHNSPSINTLNSKAPSTTTMVPTQSISTFERLFWVGMRSLSILLSIGSLIFAFLSIRSESGLSYFIFVAVASSLSVNFPHLITLPSRYSRNVHALSPKDRYLLDTVSWVLFLMSGVTMIIYHQAAENRYSSKYSEEEVVWPVKAVVAIVLFNGAALVHLVMSVYDLVDLRKGAMNHDDEEMIGGKQYMSGGVRR